MAGADKKFAKKFDKHLVSQHQESLMIHHLGDHPAEDLDLGLSSSASPPHSSALLSPPKEDGTRGNSLSASPFGPLDQAASRKTFTYLVSVLNATYPDHDFSSLQPSDFKRESNCIKVMNSFNSILLSLGMPAPNHLWDYLDKKLKLRQCTIFSHSPPESFLADDPGVMWSVTYFFLNKKWARVAHLHIKSVRHHHSPVLGAVGPMGPRPRRSTRSSIDDYDTNENDYDLRYSSDVSYDQALDDDRDLDRDDDDYDDEVVGDLEMDT